MISQIFPRTGRISGPEVGDGAKPEVPTTYLEKKKQKKKQTKQLVFYEASAYMRVAALKLKYVFASVETKNNGVVSLPKVMLLY